MANLKYQDLKKRKNSSKFIDKIFGVKGLDGGTNENNWNTDNGLFLSEGVEIGGEMFKKFDYELYTRLISADKNPGVFLYGKYSGKRAFTKVNMTKCFKSKEFGGQGSKGNAGHQFERVLNRRIDECLTSVCCKGEYADEGKHLIDILSRHVGSPCKSIEDEGSKNQKRPIKVSSGAPYIDPKNASEHGALLTDLTVHHNNKHKSYLSLKSTSTITFINAGVSTDYFVQADMKKGIVSKPKGVALLEAFGINNAMFCDVFNNYGTKKFSSIEAKPDKSKLENFMQTAIGANYHMIHELQGKIYYWYVGVAENKKYADISNSKMTIHYGGKNGMGKRVDIEFGNQYYDFKVNIRNKQGGQYPSHIMMDYKSKPATGKIIL